MTVHLSKIIKNIDLFKVSLNCVIGWKLSAESYYMYQTKVVLDHAVEKMVSILKAFFSWDLCSTLVWYIDLCEKMNS